MINNACATQAIVSVLLNCTHQDVHLGETLSEFKEFSQSFDAAVSILYFLILSDLFVMVLILIHYFLNYFR